MTTEETINAGTQARNDLLTIKERLEAGGARSRERSIVLTKIRGAVLWLREEKRVLLAAQRTLVQAAAPADGVEIKAQLAVSLPATGGDGAAPTDIQWMPPGTHQITALVNGKPGTRTVGVTAKTAERAQAALAANLAAVEAGEEDRFYFDLNHADAEASAHPTQFYWAGDDPKTGGVRAKLEWTAAGKAAVEGKNYRRFSPSFYLEPNGTEVTGVPVNAGGLVNRAAFKKIQAVRAKADNTNPTENHTMNKLLLILASLGIIKKHDVDEDTAVSQVQAFAADNQTRLDEGVKAKADLTTLKTSHDSLVKAHATSVVEQAIAEGKIPGKDDKIKAGWIEQIVANPASETLLASLQPNPALKQIVQAKGGKTQVETLVDGTEHEFVVKAKAIQEERKVSEVMARDLAAAENPGLYDKWRESFFNQQD